MPYYVVFLLFGNMNVFLSLLKHSQTKNSKRKNTMAIKTRMKRAEKKYAVLV